MLLMERENYRVVRRRPPASEKNHLGYSPAEAIKYLNRLIRAETLHGVTLGHAAVNYYE